MVFREPVLSSSYLGQKYILYFRTCKDKPSMIQYMAILKVTGAA